MLAGLVGFGGILVVYAVGVLFVHWLARRRHLQENRHYVLVAGNHEKQIEWYMRSLRNYSRRAGMDIHITVVFENSEDDTAAIVKKLARADKGIDWSYDQSWPKEPGSQETQRADNQLVWIELGRKEDVARLPL